MVLEYFANSAYPSMMTQEFYDATKVVELEPQGVAILCGCGASKDWSFWPQILNFADDCVTGPRGLRGTSDNPGSYAHQTLIWAYCAKCKKFFGGIFKSS